MSLIDRNRAFVENIFRKGPFAGHGLMCLPPCSSLWESGDYTLSDRPVGDFVPALVEHYQTQVHWLEVTGDHSVPVALVSTGTHLYAAAFGCQVHTYEDSFPCALPLVRHASEAHGVAEPDLWSCPGLMRVFELCEALEQELGKEALLSPPDLQTGFDTAALIWDKSDFYLAMLTEPEAVHDLVGKCARLLLGFLAELRRRFPQMSPAHCPGGYVPPEMGWWVSNDECGAFSTELFERFCLPELCELSETFGGLGMHCCADAEHQFESFKRIPSFYAFNRVPGKQGWDPLLEHFNGPDSPVHVLGWVAPEQAARFYAQAEGTTRFIFVHRPPDLESARVWLDQMAEVAG